AARRDAGHGETVVRVGTGEGVDAVDVLAVEIAHDLLPQAVEPLLRDRLVHLAPPDPILRALLPDEELVLRRAPGVRAGVDDERAALGEHGIASAKRMHVRLRGRRLPEHLAGRV